VFAALDAASDHCRRCGELTLAGGRRDMLAAGEQSKPMDSRPDPVSLELLLD
jgi:hypothetical protein